MKYIVVAEKNGDMFTKEFNEKEKALKAAESDWSALSDYDKKHHDAFYVLESVNPDEEAENHMDGDIIKTYK